MVASSSASSEGVSFGPKLFFLLVRVLRLGQQARVVHVLLSPVPRNALLADWGSVVAYKFRSATWLTGWLLAVFSKGTHRHHGSSRMGVEVKFWSGESPARWGRPRHEPLARWRLGIPRGRAKHLLGLCLLHSSPALSLAHTVLSSTSYPGSLSAAEDRGYCGVNIYTNRLHRANIYTRLSTS
jgi:hypothetical protein